MNWEERISSDPKIMFGKPVIKGTRIPVDLILEKLGYNYSFEDILATYPSIKTEDIQACLFFAAENVKFEKVSAITQ